MVEAGKIEIFLKNKKVDDECGKHKKKVLLVKFFYGSKKFKKIKNITFRTLSFFGTKRSKLIL